MIRDLSRVFRIGDVAPEEYLDWAKADLQAGRRSARACCNSITNAKRAIDARVESLLDALGVDCSLASIKAFLKSCDVRDELGARWMKLSVLEAFGICPTSLVKEIREIRHKVEHEYERPTRDSAIRALDVSDLFVQACRSVIQRLPVSLRLGLLGGRNKTYVSTGIVISFAIQSSLFGFHTIDRDADLHHFDGPDQELGEDQICSDDPLYPHLVRLFISSTSGRGFSDSIRSIAQRVGLGSRAKGLRIRRL